MTSRSSHKSGRFSFLLLLLAALLPLPRAAQGEDWPTYRHDVARSGVSGETLQLPLGQHWVYVPPAPPPPAWPDPQTGEQPKLDFDDAFHVALAGQMVYFGSSVDNAVHALDAATGAPRWTAVTEGPVRLAPTVADGKVYAGSDDGAIYCLDALSGQEVWRQVLLGQKQRILGSGRLMSLAPVRTGVLVDGGVAYCGAGIFPDRGTAIFALDAASGKQLWKSTEVAKGFYQTLAPQGCLLASAQQIYVPCGRSIPLRYARANGAALPPLEVTYELVGGKGLASGTYGTLIGDLFFTGSQNVLHGFGPEGKYAAQWKSTAQLVATPQRYFRLGKRMVERNGKIIPSSVMALDRAACDAAKRGVIPQGAMQWRYLGESLQSIIVAGTLVVVGGTNEVIILDGSTGKELWKAPVEGLARGLAVAQGRLLVNTDQGRIHCFAPGAPGAPAAPAVAAQIPEAEANAPLAQAIAQDSQLQRGFGLVVGGAGSSSAALALELARRTGLLVHVAGMAPEQAAAARQTLLASGDYGTKVIIDLPPADSVPGRLPYPSYFANLVLLLDPGQGEQAVSEQEILRVVKPCGGMLYTPAATAAKSWAEAGTVSTPPLAATGPWSKLVRGPLPGAGNWTHQYADAGNSSSSEDQLVRGKPQVLWYGAPGPDKIVPTHSRTEAPLCLDGRMFVQGMRSSDKQPLLLSFDAYNGVPYWEREMPGAERIYISNDCGNLACGPEGFFVATKNQCLQLDLVSGATRATFATPGADGAAAAPWAYVATVGNVLVGSESNGVEFSGAVFAYDLTTGKLKWRYAGPAIRNSTLAIEGGKVFFVEHRGQEGPPHILDVPTRIKLSQAIRTGKAQPAPPRPKADPMRTVVALDLASGKELWASEVDITRCGGWENNLCLIAKDGVVLLCGTYSAYGKAKEDENQRRALALAADNGSILWNQAIGNSVRPVVVGQRIIGRPGAFDLKTGAPDLRDGRKGPTPWNIGRQGACGNMSASANALFYRLGIIIMKDAMTGGTLMATLGFRPGCLISVIPAAGMIVQVEGSSTCTCYHAMQATVAYVPSSAAVASSAPPAAPAE